jgi:hypothetical protein
VEELSSPEVVPAYVSPNMGVPLTKTSPGATLPGVFLALTERCDIQSDEYRKNADECRQQAEGSLNALDKERWLKIAEQWLMMAWRRARSRGIRNSSRSVAADSTDI